MDYKDSCTIHNTCIQISCFNAWCSKGLGCNISKSVTECFKGTCTHCWMIELGRLQQSLTMIAFVPCTEVYPFIKLDLFCNVWILTEGLPIASKILCCIDWKTLSIHMMFPFIRHNLLTETNNMYDSILFYTQNYSIFFSSFTFSLLILKDGTVFMYISQPGDSILLLISASISSFGSLTCLQFFIFSGRWLLIA